MPSNSLASVYGLMRGMRRRRVLGPDVDIEIEACDECNTVVDVGRWPSASERRAAASSAWSACSPINIRARSILAGNSARRAARGHRRIPCQRLPLHAADPAGSAGSARSRHSFVRRRGRRPHGGGLTDIAAGKAKPIYNYLGDLPEMEAAAIRPAARYRDPRGRALRQLRCGTRLPVPVQLLHHHQRAGP